MAVILLVLIGQSGYVGSPIECIDTAFKTIGVTEKDIVYDIGCGDGRVLLIASKKFGCKSVGIEKDKNLANLAKETVERNNLERKVTILNKDALEANFSEATIVYLYHQTEFLKLLQPKLETLKPKTRVVCLDYPLSFTDCRQITVVKTKDGHQHKIFLWVVPEKK